MNTAAYSSNDRHLGYAAIPSTHSTLIGYGLWLFGFMGIHRFYFGKPVTGILWAFTGGVFLIGWFVDLFLIPAMQREAEQRYVPGRIDYSLTWLLLVLLGVFGAHRMYMGKWVTGVIYLLTGGLFLVGWVYDLLTLNEQISEIHRTGR